MSPPSVEDRLRALKADYAERLPQRAEELRSLCGRLVDHWDGAAADAVRRMAHNLAGSGATYGYPAVSAAARDLERALDQAIAAEGVDAAVQRAMDQACATLIAVAAGTAR